MKLIILSENGKFYGNKKTEEKKHQIDGKFNDKTNKTRNL